MKISGVVQTIIYKNLETGYSILALDCEGKSVTVSGKFSVVGEGEELSLDGDFVQHPKYGEQFKATKVKVKKPTTVEQIVKYLSSGLISGVGPVTAGKIVEKFGDKTLQVLEDEPMLLASVKGISTEKAMAIALKYGEIRKLQEAVIFLQEYDVSINMAVKIYDKYKGKTEEVLSKNPYKLVEDVDGIGFKTADKIAMKMGIEPDSTFRLRAGVVYCLTTLGEKNGSTLAYTEELYADTMSLLGFEEGSKQQSYEQVIADLIIDGYIKEFVDEQKTCLTLTKFYKMEKSIATKLHLLCDGWSFAKLDITKELDQYEIQNNIKLHSEQRKAVEMAVNNGVVVITGGPGTGKTTIIRAINYVLKGLGQKTLLLAPTGRASKRLAEATGQEAKTIHRALDINFKGKEFSSAFCPATQIDEDCMIVDECSMVDTYVMYNLLNALSMGKRLVLVGDKDQLPSVGAGNILGDLIDVEVIPVCSLTQIFRQAEESNIVVNAHKINKGEKLVYDNKSGDFFVMNRESQQENLELVIELVSERLPAFMGIQSSSVQVIAPMKAGVVGVTNLNKALQEKLNPAKEDKAEASLSQKLFRVGDRVMQTVNNYDHAWTREGESGQGVFNGDMGVIEEINQQTYETTVLFEDGRRCFYSIVELDELILSYAITIHKSQGSEFEAVVIPLSAGNPQMLTRNLLYTAVTRAKKMVVIVGPTNYLYMMVGNTFSEKRKTLLPKLLKDISIEL